MANHSLSLRQIDVPQLPEADCWAAKMRRAVQEAVSAEDVAAVVRRIVDDAKAGSRTAQQTLFAHVLGAGPKTVHVHQHFREKKARRKQSSTQPYEPGVAELKSRVADLRRAKGLPPAEYQVV